MFFRMMKRNHLTDRYKLTPIILGASLYVGIVLGLAVNTLLLTPEAMAVENSPTLVKSGIDSTGQISDFEQEFGPNLNFARNFGLDVESENPPLVTDDPQFINRGSGALQVRSDEDFSEGFVVGSVFTFSPAPANVLDRFNAISYWVRSENDRSQNGMTGFLQLIMDNGSIWEQFIQTPLTTSYQEVRVPLNPIGLRLSEDTVASACGDIELNNIAQIAFVIFRGSTAGEQLTAYFDDVNFIFDPNIPPILPEYSGLIDDFLDPQQYNLDHQNDVIIPLFQELEGGLTDDDRTMSPPDDPFFPNDRILDPIDPRGVLTLNWDNSDNTRPDFPELDLFFSVILEIGADISDNSYFIMRMRGQSGGERIIPLVTNQRNIRNAHPVVTLTDEFVTYNLEVSSFVDCEFRLQAIKTLTLDFPNSPDGTPSSGTIEIDNIGLSPFRHPNTVSLTFPSGLPELIDSGDELDITVELLDENGAPLADFSGDIAFDLGGGVITPSTISGFDQNNGTVTTTVNVFGDGLLQLVASDPLSNASSTPQEINLLGTAIEVTDHFRVTIGQDHDSPIDPFLEATFPVTITAFRDALETMEVDFSPSNPVAVTIDSTNGEFRLLDDGNEDVDELILTAPTTTVRGFITSSSSVAAEPGSPFSLNVRFTAVPDQIKGTGTATLRDGSGPDDELEFLRNQQQTSGLLATNLDGDIAHIYTNALATIVFTHSGGAELSRAQNILNTLRNLQISNGVNAGGFQDSYNSDGAVRGSDIAVSTGANAWVMMAINYYTLATGDTQYMEMAIRLIDFLAERQILDSNDSNFGALFAQKAIPDGDPSGLDATPGLESVFVTEHQGEAFSAFNVYAEMPWLTSAQERQGFREKAFAVKDFIENQLLIPTLGAFKISSDTEENPSIDAQTSPFLALVGVMDFRSAIEVVMDPSNNFLVSQIIDNTVPFFEDRQVSGAKFRRDPITCAPDDVEQFLWVEGSSQVALALNFITDSETGELTNPDSISLLETNIQKVQHPSGGYPTHLGTQLDECPPVVVGDSDIGVTTSAWRYFAEVSPPINPYAAVTTAEKTVSVTAGGVAIEGGTDGAFLVEVDTILLEDLTVNYTLGGTADTNDFAPLSGSVTINQGQFQANVLIDAIADDGEEGEETVTLQISESPQGEYLVGTPSSAELTIFEDPLGAISFDEMGTDISAEPVAISANGTDFSTITVQLKDSFGNPLTAEGVTIELTTNFGTLNQTTGQTDTNGEFQTTLTSSEIGIAEVTAQVDTDNDDIVDTEVINGSPAQIEFSIDTDGDGHPDNADADSDNDGVPDAVEGAEDTDGDGVPDFQDLDSDNDGINDVHEAGGSDADGDGQQDASGDGSDDEDGDGLVDSVDPDEGGTALEVPDTDEDGAPDLVDLDSDSDSVSDLIEGGSGGADADGDGVVDGPDADGDGIQDSVDDNDTIFGEDADTGPVNTDGDDDPDYLDADSDNDGTNDIVDAGNGDLDGDGDGAIDEPVTDSDGDGVVDEVDFDDGEFGGIGDSSMDADGDGIPDSVEGNGTVDSDGDGHPDNADADSDNDGVPDAVEGAEDTDGDGVPDFQDLDSDNDGINDVHEAGGSDADGDGQQDASGDGSDDEDGDGLVDSVDPDEGGTALEVPDTDEDGAPDLVDLDSDNDSVSDLIEGGSGGADADGDGVVDGPDADGDGIQDSVDDNDTIFGEDADTGPVNTDGDDDPDYLDADSDNDGTNDIVDAGNGDLDGDGDGAIDEPVTDSDGDGVVDEVDFDDEGFGGIADPLVDTDGDGIPDGVEGNGTVDSDGDGHPDNADADSDNDGVPDAVEGAEDTDGDGVPDFQDLDSDNDGINDVHEAGGSDADGDGQQDASGDGSDDEDGDGLVDSVDPDEGGRRLRSRTPMRMAHRIWWTWIVTTTV